jgi:cytochrome c biogenesis protein
VQTNEAQGSAANGGAPSHHDRGRPGLFQRFTSAQLTLWLVAILTIAMALATLVPQRAPDEVYQRAFGTALAPLFTKTALRDVYGSWWFIGAFALLALNLAACSLQRASLLLRQSRRQADPVTRDRILSRPHHLTWNPNSQSGDEAAEELGRSLRRRGYTVQSPPAGEDGEKALTARRGTLAAWAPVLVHVGMIVVLLGAAWGRLPANSYRAVADLDPGQSFTVETGRDTFSLRLLDAGQEQDPEGRPARYWARAEILQAGKVVRSGTIEPNRPLIYKGVIAVLQSLPRSGYAVEVSKGDSSDLVPVIFAPEGGVAMLDTVRRLTDPPWIVFIHDFRQAQEGEGPAAQVFCDTSGSLTHNWERVGWVDATGLDYKGVHFRLAPGSQGAQFLLDRDIGVPIVWLGFGLVVFGALLVIGVRRASIIALVAAKGQSWRVLAGASGTGAERDLEWCRAQFPPASGRQPLAAVHSNEEKT